MDKRLFANLPGLHMNVDEVVTPISERPTHEEKDHQHMVVRQDARHVPCLLAILQEDT